MVQKSRKVHITGFIMQNQATLRTTPKLKKKSAEAVFNSPTARITF